MMCSPDQILTAGFCSDTSSTLFLPRQQFLQRSPVSSLATSHPPPGPAESLSRGAWRTQTAVRGAQQDLWCMWHFQNTGVSRQSTTESTQALTSALLKTVLPHNKHECPGTAVLLWILGLSSVSTMGSCQSALISSPLWQSWVVEKKVQFNFLWTSWKADETWLQWNYIKEYNCFTSECSAAHWACALFTVFPFPSTCYSKVWQAERAVVGVQWFFWDWWDLFQDWEGTGRQKRII